MPWCDFELGDQRPGIMAALNKETLRSLVAEILLEKKTKMTSPIPSMYGIFTYVYHKIQLNVCTYIPKIDPMGHCTKRSFFLRSGVSKLSPKNLI